LLFCYITDRRQFPGNDAAQRTLLLKKIAEAARYSVDYIQLREKDLSTRDLERLANEAMRVVRENSASTRLLINSRTDVALAVDADGVHLRSDDILPSEVRSIWIAKETRPCTIGVSRHSAEQVNRAASEGADFVVFGPVFDKKNEPCRRPGGLDALTVACRNNIPVLALGGVTWENAKGCFGAGAAGIAGIRLFQENDIPAVVSLIRNSR
jgi:thiamine-phosphate pyrophosphorylase